MTLKEKILKLLSQGTPMLSMDMAEKLKVSKAAASEAAKELNRAGFIHVVEWKHSPKNGGNKIYAIGQGENVINPKHRPRFEIDKTPFKPRPDMAAAWMMTK